MVIVVLALGAVAAWGILESVALASLFTVIEVGGLVTVIVAGIHADLPIATTIANAPPLDATVTVRHRLRQPACILRIHRI